MSMITKAAGLDKLIAASKIHDWHTVIGEVEGLIRKFAGGAAADAFRLIVTVSGKD